MLLTKNLTITEFVDVLLEDGFILRASDMKLKCMSIKGNPMTQEIAGELRRRKDELLIFLENRNMPLSFSQQRLWFLDQYEDQPTANYNIPMAFRLKGTLNHQALEKAMNDLLKRHESLRTIFKNNGGEPCQIVLSETQIKIEIEELDENLLSEKINEEAGKPFDLTSGPLLRTRLFKLSDNKHVFMITQHHIISDGWSIGIMLKELDTLYNSIVNNTEPVLSTQKLQYPDYSLWQRQWMKGPELSGQLEYWKNKLTGYTNLDLPLDKVRPPVLGNMGKSFTIHIDKNIEDSVKKVCQDNQITLYMFMLAAFNTLLFRYSGQEDIVIGSPIANRTNRDTQNIIGFFVNTLVFRTSISGNDSFNELLKTAKTTCMEAYSNQDVPFEKLVDELNIERDISRSPIFQIMLTLQDSSQQPQVLLDNIDSTNIDIHTETVKFDITLNIIETVDGLKATFEYNSDLFYQNTIESMAIHFKEIVKSVVGNTNTSVKNLKMLVETEKNHLLRELNNTDTKIDTNRTFHSYFEEQVKKSPDKIAVSYENHILTYNEFNQKA
ncbi:non-ribosomal peptide synthetase, partial [bacterium]|nr:non-ribosomal peptide synthetase [bacterium]